ncbi:MAG: TolC family protein [Syntrophaceae bacterium]|nr:TolC family protein [Syntrophaceae bacterium]
MRIKGLVGFILGTMILTGFSFAQEAQKPLTLEESVKIAMERSLNLHSATLGVVGSEFRRKEAITNFLPWWTGQYGFTRYNTPSTIGTTSIPSPGGGTTTTPLMSRDIYLFNTTLNQPLFTGGLNLANYRAAKLGVDLSKENVETVKRDLVLQVRVGYFNILKAEKFLDVAKQTVRQFEAQLEVTKAFFEVGIVPKNDVLQAEVRLANARQGLVKAENDLIAARASFNILLRREIHTPVEVVDILSYQPFPMGFEESLEEALRQRSEIKFAQLVIEQAKENVKVSKSGFFPTLSLSGNYTRLSEEPNLNGDMKNEKWTVQALATFTLWNWGNTALKVGESKVKVMQAEDSKKQLIESITLEVKNDYLNLLVAEKNIKVAETAIEQAEENLRMNEERYKYQVATQTDVLDAVVLLAQTRVNYYGALSDFNIAKAQLERSMGRMYP